MVVEPGQKKMPLVKYRTSRENMISLGAIATSNKEQLRAPLKNMGLYEP